MADGSELATLSNVSEAFGLARNGEIDGENTLVTLSNIKALIDSGAVGGGGSSLESMSWADISAMSKEVNSLGADAFREKYMGLLWSTKWIKCSNKYNYWTNWHPAFLIGLAHDTKSDGSLVGFTFAIGQLVNISETLTYSDANWYSSNCRTSLNSNDMLNYLSPIKPYIVPVVKKNYPSTASTDRLWPLSGSEFGNTAAEMKQASDDYSSSDGRYNFSDDTGYVYEAFNRTLFSDEEVNSRMQVYMQNVLMKSSGTNDNYLYGICLRDSAYLNGNYLILKYEPGLGIYPSSKPIFYTGPRQTYHTTKVSIAFCI